MPKNWRFWRNVVLMGAAHSAVISGVARWNRESKNANRPSVVWLNGSPGDGANAIEKTPPPPRPKAARISTPPPELPKEEKEESEADHPLLAAAKSEIQLPPVTPSPTSTTTATPAPTRPPRPS